MMLMIGDRDMGQFLRQTDAQCSRGVLPARQSTNVGTQSAQQPTDNRHKKNLHQLATSELTGRSWANGQG